VNAPQNAELTKAALVSESSMTLEAKVKSQLPTAVSAAVVQNTKVTTATVQMASRAYGNG
jgi:hypothetical protein